MNRDDKLTRMLLWFEEQLPRHDVSQWFIEAVPYRPSTQIENSTEMRVGYDGRGDDSFMIEGYGVCARCRKRFPITQMGNARASDDSRIEPVVADMKAWVLRDAERDGACWGDVPRLPDTFGPVAVMDSGE